MTVNGHPALLRQLVTNLIRNAVIHNRVRGTLAIALGGGLSALLVIENDGERIPAEIVPTLTQPFARAAQRTSSVGHGLGLAIVSRIAEVHNTTLELTGRPAGGLLVQVRFPTPRPEPREEIIAP